MRPTRLYVPFRLSAVALGFALLGAAGPAVAADDSEAFDNKLIRGFLEGIGLQRGGSDIDYSERAPLVIPPNGSLPAPEARGVAIANNPAWPNDPDVARRKAELKAERERRQKGAQEQTDEDARVLPPDKLNPPGARNANPTKDGYVNPGWGYGNQYEMKDNRTGFNFFGGIFGSRGNDQARFTGEPPRASLTDPPSGYQTPSPNQPYGLSKETTKPKAVDYKNTQGTYDSNR